MKKKTDKKNRVLVLVSCILAAAVAIGLLAWYFIGLAPTEDIPSSEASSGERDDVGFGNAIYYNGQKYLPKENLTSILFLGVDKSDERVEIHDVLGNGGRSDTILLFLLDDETKTAQMVEISRDTITEVEIYNDEGDYVLTGKFQITMQHAYGDSPKRSNWLTKNAVSKLLYGVDLDGVMSMTMDGIKLFVDAMGGVSVTFPFDATMIDPRFEEGATVVMNGADTERFLRYRDTDLTGSNDLRMEHQSWFIRNFFHEMKGQGNLEEKVDLFLSVTKKYVETDLNAEEIKRLATYSLNEDAIKLPGETREGEKHDEYYVDEEALQKLVIELFYSPAEENS